MWSFFSRDVSKDFQYEILDKFLGSRDDLIWALHKAKKKGTDEEVSVFIFDIKSSNEVQLELARAAIKRLKTIRHPSILTYLDSIESDKVLYLATEYVEPLQEHLKRREDPQWDLYLEWGIFQITRALSFLNNDVNLRHNNVNMTSVFVNKASEWKLGGLEYLSSELDYPLKILPSLEKYDPPEISDPSKRKLITKWSSDMWGLGCLVWEIYNGPLPKKAQLKTVDNIPKSLSGVYCELVGANPGSRPNPADVITRGRKANGFFKNELVDALLFLEEIQMKDRSEKNRFFTALTSHLDHFPTHICQHKILPQLVTAFDYGDAGASVLTPMFKLGKLLDESEYQTKIVPCVVKLFASNDRATRSRLLQQLEHFIDHMQPSTVNDQVFPHVVNGFVDANPTIREQTVKSIIHLASKLNYNNLNVEVLRHFSRLQLKDDQGGIRTNTTVCLGKIAQHLHPQIRQKVLISAFVRAMKDPFPPARSAGVLALAATQQYFLLSEVATRILPALCQHTVDPEKSVRDNVFRTVKGFLGKLEKVSEDPALRESMEADVHAATPSLSNAAATWAGWAVTAVTAKFYRSQSDTVKASPRHSTKLQAANKPASLEQPSSSSISTTTSSVTSMTSLESRGGEGGESMSDYDDHWDSENWGDMEIGKSSSTMSTMEARGTDGWDTEEWGSLEEEKAETEAEACDIPNEPTHDDSRQRREEKKNQRQKELEARRAQRQSAGPMKLGAKKHSTYPTTPEFE